jgi:hypothetical protein
VFDITDDLHERIQDRPIFASRLVLPAVFQVLAGDVRLDEIAQLDRVSRRMPAHLVERSVTKVIVVTSYGNLEEGRWIARNCSILLGLRRSATRVTAVTTLRDVNHDGGYIVEWPVTTVMRRVTRSGNLCGDRLSVRNYLILFRLQRSVTR